MTGIYYDISMDIYSKRKLLIFGSKSWKFSLHFYSLIKENLISHKTQFGSLFVTKVVSIPKIV